MILLALHCKASHQAAQFRDQQAETPQHEDHCREYRGQGFSHAYFRGATLVQDIFAPANGICGIPLAKMAEKNGNISRSIVTREHDRRVIIRPARFTSLQALTSTALPGGAMGKTASC